MENNKRAYAALMVATIFWGIQPLCIKIILNEWSPATLTSVRYLLISFVLFIIAYYDVGKKVFFVRKYTVPLIFMGLTGITINNISQFTGLKYSTIVNCTLINSIGPVVTAILAAVFLRERLNVLQWIGISISMIGAILLFTKGNINILLNFSFNKGDILFFICQIVWAVYSLIGTYVMRKIPVIVVTAWAGIYGTVITFIYTFGIGEFRYVPLPQSALLAFVFIVLLGGVCSMLFWNIGVKRAGPGLAAVFSNITPMIGMFCGIVFLGESLNLSQMIGVINIMGGVYLTTNGEQLFKFLYTFQAKLKRI